VPVPNPNRRSGLIGPQDFVWILLFTALGFMLPNGDAPEVLPLLALGLVQVLEDKLSSLESARNRVLWMLLKLGLAYILIGYTGAIRSLFWPLLLLPVVSAANFLGVWGTQIFTLLAGSLYLSFLAWGDTPPYHDLAARVIFLLIAGHLANTLAEELRVQSQKYRRTAEQLAAANIHIQEAEEAVRRADRLAALGQLTAGLAHELRNPLGTIKASAEMITRAVQSENEIAREMAGFISAEVDRTNSLVTRFLQFARPLELRLDKTDLTKTLDRAVEMVQREAPGISIYSNYDPGVPPFPFDSELMERVFYNLILNAAQATAAGGAVTVKTRVAGDTADISIIDRGVGIDPKQVGSIFNPFFTTKPEGVGLGLAIVAKIVDQHGGKIAVESEPGKGSIFHVLLPMNGA
jgi:two-component system, NtrC family, sensor histidine kinase HydH